MLDTLRRRRDGRAGRDTSYIEAKHIRRRLRARRLDAARGRGSHAETSCKRQKIHDETACEHIEGEAETAPPCERTAEMSPQRTARLRLMYCDGVNTSPSAPAGRCFVVLWLLMLLSLLGTTAEFFFTGTDGRVSETGPVRQMSPAPR